jgi:hypothetical protein
MYRSFIIQIQEITGLTSANKALALTGQHGSLHAPCPHPLTNRGKFGDVVSAERYVTFGVYSLFKRYYSYIAYL